MNPFKPLVVFVCMSLVLAACGGGGGSGNGASEPLPFPHAPAAGVLGDGRLGEIVEWTRASQELPAMAVVVVLDGQVVEIAAEGLRSLSGDQAVTTADAWHIGSLTKGITATLAGVLVELSVLSWDTTPLDVWPELDASIHANFRDITVRQLLSHTAGVQPVNAAPSRYSDAASGTLAEKRRAFAAELLTEEPVARIGVHSYSNGGYIIVGAMMETLMSASWETLVSDYVFASLNMTHSGFGAPGTPNAITQPWGHWDRNNGFEPVSPGTDADNPQVFGPAGTVHTSLQDYTNFLIAHIDGWRGVDGFLTAETFEVLHTPVNQGAALGWGVIQSDAFPGMIELAHAGSNLRWYAVVRMVPELNRGALFVVNAGGPRAEAAIDRLDDFIAQRYAATQ